MVPAFEIAPDLIEAGARQAIFQFEILPLDPRGTVGGDFGAEVGSSSFAAGAGRWAFALMHNCI